MYVYVCATDLIILFPPLIQMCLQCSVSVGVAVGLREVMVDKSLSIGECCRVMALTLGLEGESEGWGGAYHGQAV